MREVPKSPVLAHIMKAVYYNCYVNKTACLPHIFRHTDIKQTVQIQVKLLLKQCRLHFHNRNVGKSTLLAILSFDFLIVYTLINECKFSSEKD